MRMVCEARSGDQPFGEASGVSKSGNGKSVDPRGHRIGRLAAYGLLVCILCESPPLAEQQAAFGGDWQSRKPEQRVAKARTEGCSYLSSAGVAGEVPLRKGQEGQVPSDSDSEWVGVCKIPHANKNSCREG